MTTNKKDPPAHTPQSHNQQMRQVTVKFPAALYNDIKKLSIDLNKEIYTVFREALTEYLGKHNSTVVNPMPDYKKTVPKTNRRQK